MGGWGSELGWAGTAHTAQRVQLAQQALPSLAAPLRLPGSQPYQQRWPCFAQRSASCPATLLLLLLLPLMRPAPPAPVPCPPQKKKEDEDKKRQEEEEEERKKKEEEDKVGGWGGGRFKCDPAASTLPCKACSAQLAEPGGTLGASTCHQPAMHALSTESRLYTDHTAFCRMITRETTMMRTMARASMRCVGSRQHVAASDGEQHTFRDLFVHETQVLKNSCHRLPHCRRTAIATRRRTMTATRSPPALPSLRPLSLRRRARPSPRPLSRARPLPHRLNPLPLSHPPRRCPLPSPSPTPSGTSAKSGSAAAAPSRAAG